MCVCVRVCVGVCVCMCCRQAERSNPEVDSCGWSEDRSQQQWAFDFREDREQGANQRQQQQQRLVAATATATAANTTRRFISLQQNMCLAIAGDLEVYVVSIGTPGVSTTDEASVL